MIRTPSSQPRRRLRALRVALLLCLACLSGGCPPPNRIRVEAQAIHQRLPGIDVQPTRAFPTHPGARKRGFHVIRTRAEWVALWPAPFVAPTVDFSREMILVAFAGEKRTAGHALTLDRITREGDTLHVALEERLPAPTCPLPPGPTHPALLRAVPRHLGEVRFVVRQQQDSSCMSPPALDFSCHVERPGAPYQNRGLTPHPRVGQSVVCAATVEPKTRLDFHLLSVPDGARVELERIDEFHVRLPIRAEGLFRVGALASRVDGMATRMHLDVEAGIPNYEIELVEEEPEGARGLTLRALRREKGPPAGDAADVCTARAPRPWCSPSSDGYTARITVPADTPGEIEIWIDRQLVELAPQARLMIRLGRRLLFDEALPDEPAAWTAGRRLVATLSPAEARLSLGDRDAPRELSDVR